jgi:hypothetical protein
MTDLEIRERLTSAVDDVEPAPDLLDTVRRSGARRLRRRRGAAAGITASVLALGAIVASGNIVGNIGLGDGGVAATVPVPASADPYRRLLDRPTGGDLKHDSDYLTQVVAAWDASHRYSVNHGRGIFDDLRGGAHVVWAGTTRAGRVAIVAQQAYLHHHGDIRLDREGVYTLVGWVQDSPRGPQVVADSYPAPGMAYDGGFLAGPDRKTLIAVDLGRRVGYSTGLVYGDDGRISRERTELRFSGGVAVVELPADADPSSVRITDLPVREPASFLELANQQVDAAEDQRMWMPTGEQQRQIFWHIGGATPITVEQADAVFEQTMTRLTTSQSYSVMVSGWHAAGTTPDGRLVVAGERELGGEPSHVFAVLKGSGKVTALHGGVADRSKPLPVAIRLPDAQGWVVAQKAAGLSYRVGAGEWRTAGRDAALLPDDATEVRVVLDGVTKYVPLTR